MKEKSDFRVAFDSNESRQRCSDIWHEFSEDASQGKVLGLKTNLFVKIVSLTQKFEPLGLKMTFQLFVQSGKAHSHNTQITSNKDQWLFTEIPFAETLLRDDLVMIIKVFKVYNNISIKKNQQVNSKSNEPMQLSFLKAFSIVNISDAFFENRMKDGKPLEPF